MLKAFFQMDFFTFHFEASHFQNLSTWAVSVFFRKKNPGSPKPTKLCPLDWIVNDFYHGSSLARPATTCFGRCGPRKVRVTHKKRPFFETIFRVAGLSGSFLCLETWDWGAGWLRAQLGEEKPFFFKGKNYSGFIWFIDLNEQFIIM